MKKLTKLIILFMSFMLFTNAYAIDLYSNNAIIYNLDEDRILYAKNNDEEISIASLTKIMTAIVSIENINDIKEYVIVPKGSLDKLLELNASVAGFKENDKVTYEDLLYGLMLPSGADAAKALSILIAGNEDEFVKLMNAKAKELNMTHTHFKNTSGLDEDDHYSSINDLLTLLKYSLKNDTFKTIFETNEYHATNNLVFKSTQYKTALSHKLDTSYIIGSKTGTTEKAGRCLAALFKTANTNIISITAGTKYDNVAYNLLDSIKIHNYLDSNYKKINLINENDDILTLVPKYSDSITFKSNKTITSLISNYNDTLLKLEYDGKELIGNEKKDTYLGKVKVIYDNELINELEIKLDHNLKINYLKFIKIHIRSLIIISLILIISILLIIKRKIKK